MSHKVRKLGNFVVGDIYCINLKKRKGKMQWMKRQAKKKGFWPLKFHKVNLHKDPKRGCLESHVDVIRMAQKRRLPNVLILEDDAKLMPGFKGVHIDTSNVPDDWDMLYLGGNIQEYIDIDPIRGEPKQLEDGSTQEGDIIKAAKIDDGGSNGTWRRARCWTTHAYIIHQRMYSKIIKEATKWDKEIDVFYKDIIHPKHRCYVSSPLLFSQKAGYSDIEGRDVDYKGVLEPNDAANTIDNARCEYEQLESGGTSTTLKLNPLESNDMLPKVSIVTPTYNHKEIFNMAIRNFSRFNYPANKLQWVIVDDSDVDPDDPDNPDNPKNQTVKHLLPKDGRIKYVRCKNKVGISKKRNMCVKYADHDIIVHMDDDDYYPPESILSRVRVLMTYPHKGCVGSTMVGIYDMKNDASALTLDLGQDGERTVMCEASMAYHREFWADNKFNKNVAKGEGVLFIRDRLDRVINVPYAFIVFAITHNKNYTENLRAVSEKQAYNFPDLWDADTRLFVQQIRKEIYGLPETSTGPEAMITPETNSSVDGEMVV